MTKSFEKISMESLQGLDYSTTATKQTTPEISEPPVLDLSCKKSPSPSPTTDYAKEAMVSPLRGSSYMDSHSEANNNNDNKHISCYQYQQQGQNQEVEQAQHSHYHHEETSTFSSSNHERKSPFENRVYVMTPPSESDSPKKAKFQTVYDHTNSLSIPESRVHPAYPMMPLNLPVPMPISVPTVLPALISQNAAAAAAAVAQVPQMQMPTSSTAHEVPQPTNSGSSDESKKAPRPFKAYPKDPLSITLGPDMMFDQELKKAYSDFRNRMLDSVKRTNEGTNIKMRRVSKSPMLPTSTVDEKDAAYWERRRKNNEAAKRSRDARRAKEDEIAIRAAFLEQEYIRLKYENAVLKDENAKIKCMLYGR